MGILVSANVQLIDELKRDVSIWNINSYGEFYMQISEKYKNDYIVSLEKLKRVRKEFIKNLSEISWLHVIPSQANYLLIEIMGITSKELTKILFLKYNLLIKDLSKKIRMDGRQFVRVAIRNSEDNKKLVDALKEIF